MANALATINVGVVGTGFMGVAHTEALRRLGVNVVGIVGSTPERARQKAEQANLPRVFDSLDAMLAEPQIHAIHITLQEKLLGKLGDRAGFHKLRRIDCPFPSDEH